MESTILIMRRSSLMKLLGSELFTLIFKDEQRLDLPEDPGFQLVEHNLAAKQPVSKRCCIGVAPIIIRVSEKTIFMKMEKG